MKKIICSFFLSFFFINTSFSQHNVLKGRVLNDSTGSPVISASIEVDHGSIFITDSKGMFQIKLTKPIDTLIVSAVGYETAIIHTDKLKNYTLTVRLIPKRVLMQEVMVSTGYQTLPKERVTGSFESIDNKLFNRSVSTDVLSRLEGVTSIYFNHFTQSTQTVQLFIHGLSTLNASTDPLIILDNFPYEGNIDNIDPNNIENITILKDAAASSIWGARAGNGVIVITSKKPKYNQTKTIFFNTNLTIQAKPDLYADRNWMTSSDFIGVEKFLYGQGYYNSDLSNTYSFPVISPVVEILAQQSAGQISADDANNKIAAYSKLDLRQQYLKYLYRPAVTQQYNAGISGGENNINYSFGFGYDKNVTSVIGNAGYRANINAQLNIRPFPKLELQTNIVYTLASDTYNGITSVTPGGGKYYMYPYAQLADAAGNSLVVQKDYRSGYIDTTGKGYLLNWQYNPLDDVKNSDNTISRNDIQISLGLTYHFSKAFNMELRGQMEKTNQLTNYYYSTQTYYTRNIINRFSQMVGDVLQLNVPYGGILDRQYSDLLSDGLRAQFNYSTNIGKWYKFNAIAGSEVRDVNTIGQNTRTYGYDNNTLTYSYVDYNAYYTLWQNLGSDQIEDNSGFVNTDNRYVSLFSNGALTIHDKYSLSASVRKDASNLFGVNTNQKWNPFWSVGTAWKVSDESFYKIPFLPIMKLRVTYGYSGNILPGQSAKPVITYSTNYVIPVPFASATSPANPDLRWEKTGTLNTGIDFASKGNRISGSFDYYIKKSTDLFDYVPVDPTLGITVAMLNADDLRSTGFDLRLNGIIINRRFKWQAQLLLDHVKNIVTKAYNDYPDKGGYVGGGYTTVPIKGEDPYAIFAFKWAGLDPTNGDPRGFLDGKISKDYLSLIQPTSFDQLALKGSSRPSLYGSIRNSFSYKNFSISANIMYEFGFYFQRSAINYSALYSNWAMNKEFAQRWQKPGDELKTNVPSMVYPGNYYRDFFYDYSEATIEKGDNIRLKDIQMSYDFPHRLKSPFLKNSQVYLYLNNLGILWRANNEGIDPDYGSNLPQSISASIGFKTNF